MMQKDERVGRERYEMMCNELPQAARMLDEERLHYVGAMVLGLNDALVELTGAIAGVTFALANARLVAMTGIITGISATLSMAASNYLAERAEGKAEALKSSAYTGTAYLVTVALLVLPYLLFPAHMYVAAFAVILPGTGEEIIQILQLDEMKRRIRTRFVSTSLSLICGRQVVVSPLHYARGLEELAGRMEQFPSYRLFLADGTDDICLPDINCWCHGTSWMVQMDAQGFRVCRESTLSGAAYITLEQGWRRVPPARKDRDAVLSVLRSLIAYIKDCFL